MLRIVVKKEVESADLVDPRDSDSCLVSLINYGWEALSSDSLTRCPSLAASLDARFLTMESQCGAVVGADSRVMAMSGAMTRRPAMANAALSRLMYAFTFFP